MVAVLRFAVDVEADFLFSGQESDHFGLDEGDVCDHPGVLADEGVEEMYGDVLVALAAEQPLESEIGKRVDENKPPFRDDGVHLFFC